jgi:hypothetical protein
MINPNFTLSLKPIGYQSNEEKLNQEKRKRLEQPR